MYTQRSKYWPAYTWKAQRSYSSEIKGKLLGNFNISDTDFEKTYFDIFDKVNASFYHLERLKENEKIAVQTGKELAKMQIPETEGVVGVAGSPYEPIEYEYEAFLVTIKSALDFMAILLANGFSKSEDNIVALVNRMQSDKINPSLLEGKIYALLSNTQFSAFIDNYKNPKNQKSKRNFAVHKGSLPIGTINIPINNPHTLPLLSKVIDPNDLDPYASIPHSQNLVEFCENQFYQTCDLLIEVLSLITNTRLKPGPKSSVYDQRVTK